jgi:ArsR family transcriptional regulator
MLHSVLKEYPMVETIEQPTRTSDRACCAPNLAPQIDAGAAKQLSDDFSILGHPIRLQILDMLAQHGEDVCVCDLEAALPVKQPTVSHHLRLLREAGLIDCERRGLWAYYFIRKDTLQAMRARVLAQFDAMQ